MDVSNLQAELAKLKEENARLKAGKAKGLKVSDKGAVSVYGMGKFPITHYAEQWEVLFSLTEEIRSFIKTNQALITERTNATRAARGVTKVAV